MTPTQLARFLNSSMDGSCPTTALEVRPDIGKHQSIELFLKREDRLDDIGSGHKCRKLHYLREVIQQQRADVLITAGSLPSGQCVAVAAAARRLGLRSRVIYLGDVQVQPHEAAGHYLYASALASRVDWFERRPWGDVDELLQQAAADELMTGSTPFIVFPGISEWPATLGSVELGLQVFLQLSEYPSSMGMTHIVALAGTGATCLGLWTASEALKAGWIVHGICMGSSVIEKRRRLTEIANRHANHFGIPLDDFDRLRLHEFDWSGMYATPSVFELEAMQRVLLNYQLPLDPNYMIKAFLGFEELVQSGEIAAGDRVVLIHSGGSLDFVAGTPAAKDWLQARLKGRSSSHSWLPHTSGWTAHA